MQLDLRSSAKLRRTVRYGGLALIVAWSLLALAVCAAVESIVAWFSAEATEGSWMEAAAVTMSAVDRPMIAGAWMLGAVLIFGLIWQLRRLSY